MGSAGNNQLNNCYNLITVLMHGVTKLNFDQRSSTKTLLLRLYNNIKKTCMQDG